MGLNGLCEEHYKALAEAGKPKEAQAPASCAAAPGKEELQKKAEAASEKKEDPKKKEVIASIPETDKEDQQ